MTKLDHEQHDNLMSLMGDRFLTLAKNDKHNRVDIHVRGEFDSPQNSTKDLTELYDLSETYTTACIYINSEGGRIDTLMELVNVLGKFDSVITVVTSNASSAGFMLWSIGDVRVVCPSAEMMVHRETSGYIDKTYPMHDRVTFLKRRFDKLFVDLCNDVLTEEELEEAKRGELWFLGEDFIDRGIAVSWESFIERDQQNVDVLPILTFDDVMYAEVGGMFIPVEEIKFKEYEAYRPMDIVYALPNTESIVSVEDVEDEYTETKEKPDDDTTSITCPEEAVGSFDTVRDILRNKFGKGNFSVETAGLFGYTALYGKLGGKKRKVLEGDYYEILEDYTTNDIFDLIENVINDYLDED